MSTHNRYKDKTENKVKSFTEVQGLKISHRKEDRLHSAIMAIDKKGDVIAEARLYQPSSMAFACVWITYAGLYANGSGQAGGGGYHKLSAALEHAITSAGFTMAKDIHGRGEHAMRDAIEAIGRHLAKRQFLAVIYTHG